MTNRYSLKLFLPNNMSLEHQDAFEYHFRQILLSHMKIFNIHRTGNSFCYVTDGFFLFNINKCLSMLYDLTKNTEDLLKSESLFLLKECLRDANTMNNIFIKRYQANFQNGTLLVILEDFKRHQVNQYEFFDAESLKLHGLLKDNEKLLDIAQLTDTLFCCYLNAINIVVDKNMLKQEFFKRIRNVRFFTEEWLLHNINSIQNMLLQDQIRKEMEDKND